MTWQNRGEGEFLKLTKEPQNLSALAADCMAETTGQAVDAPLY